ncbi:hypothetical protein G6F24_017123 [Rhizopus arrhizus]|nr:hypothetical protein G6F24_017123 [Rhizopus arrhizus]
MLRACGEHQQQLGFGAERLGGNLGIGLQHQAADALGPRRTARLAGQHHLVAVAAQAVTDGIDGGGLARTLAAFQADETRVAKQRGTHCAGVSWVRCRRSCCR